MFAYLSGTAIGADVICVGGVGYAVRSARPLVVGQDVEVFVRTTITQDQITLWAFESTDERATFDALCKVAKVGPSTALAVLGELSPAELAGAVAAKDVAAISAAKGVGRKTAETIVAFVDLPGCSSTASPANEITKALVDLGFDPSAVDQVLGDLAESGTDLDDAQAALPLALAQLGGRT
jgi:Holliday junction DNA helicase RuvA